MLRPYQSKSIQMLYDWLRSNEGNPCLVLPTGSGKSHIIAALCKDALQSWPETRILMLAHQKELIEQNYSKLRQHWPNAPIGVYSASLKRKELGEPITFAGIQSIRNKAPQIGYVDLIIIDESHLVSHKDEGSYRTLINQLKETNPDLRVIGLTASPYRLGHGLITDDPAIFDALIEPVIILELVEQGFLSPLRSKLTDYHYDTTGIKKRGGDYIESELQKRVNVDDINQVVVDEIIARAVGRKSWILFCTGIEHSEAINQCLVERGIKSVSLSGKTGKKQRESIIEQFKAGSIQALCNVNVLTTGFDAPNIDLIAMLRPTQSPGLYLQMAGRGMRLKEHTDHCLVLDFAGNVSTHGPITDIQPPSKTGNGEVKTKGCPECGEVVITFARQCSACGFIFSEPEEEEETPPVLHQDDIMGLTPLEMEVTDWKWTKHKSRTSGKEMIKLRYYGGLSDPIVDEYFPVTHSGYAAQKAIKTLIQIGGTQIKLDTIEETIKQLAEVNPPTVIKFRKDGKFFRVIARVFS